MFLPGTFVDRIKGEKIEKQCCNCEHIFVWCFQKNLCKTVKEQYFRWNLHIFLKKILRTTRIAEKRKSRFSEWGPLNSFEWSCWTDPHPQEGWNLEEILIIMRPDTVLGLSLINFYWTFRCVNITQARRNMARNVLVYYLSHQVSFREAQKNLHHSLARKKKYIDIRYVCIFLVRSPLWLHSNECTARLDCSFSYCLIVLTKMRWSHRPKVQFFGSNDGHSGLSEFSAPENPDYFVTKSIRLYIFLILD